MDIEERVKFVRGEDSPGRIAFRDVPYVYGEPAAIASVQGAVRSPLSGSLDAYGNFSVGVVPRQRILKGDAVYEDLLSTQEYFTLSRWHYDEGLVEVCFQRDGDLQDRFILPPKLMNQESDLLDGGVRRHGLSGITPLGRRNVRDGASLLQRRYGPKKLGFFTLTIPGFSDTDVAEINRNWSRLTNDLFTWMKRQYESQGVTFSYVSCTEIQESRLRGKGQLALHLHWVAPCFNGKRFVISAAKIRAKWGSLLCRVIGVQSSDVPTGACLDSQIVKESAASYLSKYMSKGSAVVDEVVEGGHADQLPSQWWSVSNNVRQALKVWRVPLVRKDLEFLFGACEHAADWQGEFEWLKLVEYVDSAGEKRVCGFYGRLKSATLISTGWDYKYFRGLDNKLSILV